MSAEMITAIGALITGISSLVGAIVLHRKTIALIEYRLHEVEKRLDSHNHYAEMFSETSDRITRMETDIKWVCKFLGKDGDGK